MKEVWKDIKNYEGLYQISNQGRVKRLETGVNNGCGWYLRKEHLIKTSMSSSGYLHFSISINSRRKDLNVHRTLAQTFISNPENKSEVNHKNGIKSDNALSNLEWVTRSENMGHAYDTGLTVALFGEQHQNSLLTEKEVLYIREMIRTNMMLRQELADELGVTYSCIRSIDERRSWRHI